MDIKINGKDLLEMLTAARKDDRKQTTLYLSQSVYGEFKKVCGVIPPSVVIETLMKEFLLTTKDIKRKK